MSVEIYGFDGVDQRLANTASIAASDLLLAQGVEAGTATTIGNKGAEYGAAVIFTALREMGMWPPVGFDPDEFEIVVRNVVSRSK